MNPPAAAPRYAPNKPSIAFEAFDDEVVLIHFQSGRYFRLDEVGRAVWTALDVAGGADEAAICTSLASRFEASTSALAAAVGPFLAQLADHDLVVTGQAIDAGAESERETQEPTPPAERRPFSAPELSVFTDLEDILLLDPVHDVDESGWPHAHA